MYNPLISENSCTIRKDFEFVVGFDVVGLDVGLGVESLVDG
jgi:hypothetical protein